MYGWNCSQSARPSYVKNDHVACEDWAQWLPHHCVAAPFDVNANIVFHHLLQMLGEGFHKLCAVSESGQGASTGYPRGRRPTPQESRTRSIRFGKAE